MASRRAHLVLRGVGDDVEQPWAKWTTGVETIKRAMSSQKAFLSGVGGAIRSGDRRRDAYRGALVATNEIVVRVVIAGLGPPDRLCLVQNTSRLISLSPHLHHGKLRSSRQRRRPGPGRLRWWKRDADDWTHPGCASRLK
jgi:hypothetical protein